MDDLEEFRLFSTVAGHFQCVEAIKRFRQLTPEQRAALRLRFIHEGLVQPKCTTECEHCD